MSAHDDASHLSGRDAKGFAEAIKVMEQVIRDCVRDIRNLFDIPARRTARKISTQLHSLHFDSDEFRTILSRIANGKVDQRDARKISRLLQNTAGEVSAILFDLSHEHRAFIEKKFGAQLWKEIDDRIREVKFHIRERID